MWGAVPVFGYSTKAQTQLGLRFVPSPAQAAQAARSLTGALSPDAVRLLPSAAPASVSACAGGVCAPCVYSWELAFSRDPPGGCRPSRISGSLWLETGGLFSVWEGMPSLGLSLPLSPAPCLLSPAGMAGSSLEFLSPFVLRTAGGVFRPVNFSLLSHSLKKSPSDCSQGLLAGPYPKQCRRLLSVSPPLAGGGCGRLGYLSAGSCF